MVARPHDSLVTRRELSLQLRLLSGASDYFGKAFHFPKLKTSCLVVSAPDLPASFLTPLLERDRKSNRVDCVDDEFQIGRPTACLPATYNGLRVMSARVMHGMEYAHPFVV